METGHLRPLTSPGWSPGSHVRRRLNRRQVGELVRLAVGGTGSARTIAELWARTDGDPRAVLIHLLVAVADEEPKTLEAVLAELAEGIPDPRAQGVCRRDGDYWTLSYEGVTVRVRDMRGLHYLVPLLREPGTAIDVRTLVESTTGRLHAADKERARQAVTKGIGALLERLRRCHPALAQHLRTAVHRGARCAYLVDASRTIRWRT